jgi:6-phosphofructokinase 1
MVTATRTTVEAPTGKGELTVHDVRIKDLGRCRFASPVADLLGEQAMHYVGEADKVLVDDRLSNLGTNRRLIAEMPAFELAGPRNRIFYQPSHLRCAIVTCGGLCPGLNNVVRGLVAELNHGYGISQVLGLRYGFEGMTKRFGHRPMVLDRAAVADIHTLGGTILGTSRGTQDPAEMVDFLVSEGIDILFVIGGDGSMRGAMSLTAEIERRELAIGVVGVPKTIDNDIEYIDRSFGFETAFSAGVDAIRSAQTEARGMRNGIGLVKLMGRHSGFIACQASLASSNVSAVLIPEVPLHLDGDSGLFTFIQGCLARHGHAVVVVAEGAGQHLCTGSKDRDASGNLKLHDIGSVLRDSFNQHFAALGNPVNLKYIDPSYHIRSVPASPSDAVYCWHMARNAVHAALAGNTEMIIGRWHGRFVHVPMALATRSRKRVDPTGDLWMSVIEATGQPVAFT